MERLDYYRGHRAGCEARLAVSGGRLPTVSTTSLPEAEVRDPGCSSPEHL